MTGPALVPASSRDSFSEICWLTCWGDRLSIDAVCSSVNFRLGLIIPAAFSVSTFDVCGFGMGGPSGVNCCWLLVGPSESGTILNRRTGCQGARSQSCPSLRCRRRSSKRGADNAVDDDWIPLSLNHIAQLLYVGCYYFSPTWVLSDYLLCTKSENWGGVFSAVLCDRLCGELPV